MDDLQKNHFKRILVPKSGFTFRSLENSCFENLEYFGINVTFLRHIDVTGKIENIYPSQNVLLKAA